MTHLRKMMLEELLRRNFAESTAEAYIRAVKEFSQYFNIPPYRLGPRHIREYQAALFQIRWRNTWQLYVFSSPSIRRACCFWSPCGH